MSIRIFDDTEGAGNPSPPLRPSRDSSAVIDEEQLAAEVLAGETVYGQVPLSQTHLFALAASAQQTIGRADCPIRLRAHLEDFLLWCTKNAHFGPQTRALLAWQQAELHRHPPT